MRSGSHALTLGLTMPDGWSVLFTCRIQIPRIFNVYASLGMLSNWGEMLDNIFRPLFAVSCDPDSDPLLDSFLQHVSGIDSVDDESKLGLDQPETLPADWTSHENPSYRMCKALSCSLLIAGALLLAASLVSSLTSLRVARTLTRTHAQTRTTSGRTCAR